MAQHIIQLGGEPRALKFTTYSICELEESLGESVLEEKFFMNPSFRKIVALLWAGMLYRNPKLTTKMVATWLDEVTREEVFEMFSEGIKAFMANQGIESTEEQEKNE